MKRPPEYITERCKCCKREGYTRQVQHSLWTPEEYGHPVVVEGLPPGYEPMMASAGSSIYDAVKEAIEFCQTYKAHGVGFDFNDKLVLVDPYSDVAVVVKEWWRARYGETQAESFAKR